MKQALKRDEVLDFVSKKYSRYAWSLRTLCRRLHYFDIIYIDYEIELDDLEESVREEMNGPGNLLGYHAKTKNIREIHGQKVPRNLVYAMMELSIPVALNNEDRATKASPKGCFYLKLLPHSRAARVMKTTGDELGQKIQYYR